MEKKEKKNNNFKMILLIVGVILGFIVLMFVIKSKVGVNKNGDDFISKIIGKEVDFKIVDSEEALVQTRFLNKAEDDFRKSELKNRETMGELQILKNQMEVLTEELKKQKYNTDKATSLNAQKTTSPSTNLPAPPVRDFSDIFKKFPNALSPHGTQVKSITKPQDTPTIPIIKPLFKRENTPTKQVQQEEDIPEVTYEYEEIENSMTISKTIPKKSKEVVTKKSENSTSSNSKYSNSIPKDAFFIPAGSVTVAYLEQGYDAPTLKTGMNDLVPSTLTIVGYTLLPNNKLYDLRGCKILAEAEGKRSNERSYSRTKRLSCINNENLVMDIPLKGYISDEGGDGKLGLKGNIVSMQNKFLQNAVWVGIVEGLANIGKATSMTQNATLSGAVATIDKGKEFQAGMATGLIDTTSSIKDFLMENVKSIEPVIEIKGGRLVAITLSEGIYIYPRIDYKG